MSIGEKNMDLTTIGGRVKYVRMRSRSSQNEFARRIFKTSGYISRVENNLIQASDEVLQAIASFYEVDYNWIKYGGGIVVSETDYDQGDEIQIGGRLLELRRENGMIQAELAEKIGCSVAYVKKLEQGRGVPSSSFVRKAAQALGVSCEWLLTGHGQKESSEAVREEKLGYIVEFLRDHDEELDRVYKELCEKG